MLRRGLSIICIIALLTATSAPTVAAAGFDPHLGAPYNGFGNSQRSAELTAGVYLRVPFSGGPRRSLSETRFGLAVGARLPAYDRYDSGRSLADMPKLLDLSIGLRGRESLRLNGLSLIDMPTLYADEDGKPKNSKVWLWIVGGAAVVGIFVIGGTAAAKAATKDFPSNPDD